MAGTSVMQQSRVLGGAQLPQQKASAARPLGRSTAVRTVSMAKRKVNTFDEGWKKVREDGMVGTNLAGLWHQCSDTGRSDHSHKHAHATGPGFTLRHESHAHTITPQGCWGTGDFNEVIQPAPPNLRRCNTRCRNSIEPSLNCRGLGHRRRQ